MIQIFADGCSLGNPGPAGIGVVIYRNKSLIAEKSAFIGQTTNNVAEYAALVYALQEVAGFAKNEEVFVCLDSQLIVNQLSGKYKIKNKNIYPFSVLAKHLINLIGDCKFSHVVREKNKRADYLAKKGAANLSW